MTHEATVDEARAFLEVELGVGMKYTYMVLLAIALGTLERKRPTLAEHLKRKFGVSGKSATRSSAKAVTATQSRSASAI